ncbi:hypothetical protein ABUL04_07680 [Micromonospora harpali]|uniref:Uncharacterized protein n=1 Tax=Micromonospora harpali TaxID=1490225 RepID=A0ABW1HNF6_9ACTN
MDCYLPGKDRSEGVDAAKRLGNATFDLAKTATGKISSLITDRASGRRGGDEG